MNLFNLMTYFLKLFYNISKSFLKNNIVKMDFLKITVMVALCLFTFCMIRYQYQHLLCLCTKYKAQSALKLSLAWLYPKAPKSFYQQEHNIFLYIFFRIFIIEFFTNLIPLGWSRPFNHNLPCFVWVWKWWMKQAIW